MRQFVGNVILEGLTSLEPLVGWKPIAEKVVEVPDDPDAAVWHVCCFQVDEQSLSERLGSLAKAMHPHWYAHFLDGDDLVVILAGKFFWAKASDKNTWREFITYGDTIGIDRKWTENMATQHPAWVEAAISATAKETSTMTDNQLAFRLAKRDDLPDIVRMLADDLLGAKREEYTLPLPLSYYTAFDAIDSDPNNELIVAELDGRVCGVLQLTYIPYLTYRGRWRALIEGVRVDSSRRGSGIGRKLFQWAIERAQAKGCQLVQLTTDKARPDAIRFYESLGFVASHEGMKLHFS